MASTTFGEPRMTLDVDMAADIHTQHMDRLLREIEQDFNVDPDWPRTEVAGRGTFQLMHKQSMIRVDIFVPEWTGFDLWKWEQRRRLITEATGPEGVDITHPEGVILQKLVWFRKTGDSSDRQWRDVLGVLKSQGAALDLTAVREWSHRLMIDDLLEKALLDLG